MSNPPVILETDLARLNAEGWSNACPRNTGLWVAAGWMVRLRRGDEIRVVIVADADPDQFSGGSAIGGAQEESGRRVPDPETFGPSVPPGFNVPLAQQGLRLVPTMMLGRVCLVAAQGGSVANVPGSIAVGAHSGDSALKFRSSDPLLQRNAGAVGPWDFLFLAVGVIALGFLMHAGASLRHQTPGERLNGPARLWAVSRLLRAFRR